MIDTSAASEWLRQQGLRATTIQPLAGDVSARRYFRVHQAQGASLILAGYPPGHSRTYHLFVETTRLMQAAGVRVPKILCLDDDDCWMLLEDVGDTTLYSEKRSWPQLETFFLEAVETQKRIRRISISDVASVNPHLNAAALSIELDQTFEVVLVPLGMVSDKGLRRLLEDTLELICQSIGSADLVPCHRDFMARNLVSRAASAEGQAEGDGRALVVLDHQDLRLGPSRYDLASLLNDSLFPPAALEARLLDAALDSEAELDAYHRAAVQRTLKAVGTFGAFARRGFATHLPLIPPTLRRCLDHLALLPEGRELADDLRREWNEAQEGSLLDSLRGPSASGLI